MFSSREIPGKGVGSFAECVINPGTLLLRDTPIILMDEEEMMEEFRMFIKQEETVNIIKQAIVPEWTNTDGDRDGVVNVSKLLDEIEGRECVTSSNSMLKFLTLLFEIQAVIKSYQQLSSEDKEKFLKLADSKSHLHLQDRNTDLALRFGQIEDTDKELAAKILGIAETNSFQKGVFLKMSRFNHSCRPNAEYFWNKDDNCQDLRAIKKIDDGKEITISYIIGLKNPLTRDGRRLHLKNTFNFDCQCEVCCLSGKPLEKDEKLRFKVMEENKKHAAKKGTVANVDVDVLVQDAVKCGGVGISEVIDGILEKAFKDACSNASLAKNNNNLFIQYLSKRKNIKAASRYASDAEKLSRLLKGENHSSTQMWSRRKDHPIVEFTRQSLYIRHWIKTVLLDD